jgi:hypothetical protein
LVFTREEPRVDTVPSWNVPHYFHRHFEAAREEEVVTFGLFAPLLARADPTREEGLSDLSARIGFDEIVKLAYRGVQPSSGRPWAEVMSQAEAGQQPEPPQPDSLADLLADAEALDRIRVFVEDFRHLVDELEAAADESRQPRALAGRDQTSKSLLGLLEDYYGRDGRGLELQPLFRRDRPERLLWGFRFRDLAERVAVELFDVYSRRPRLRRCRLCHRVFVSAGDEQGRQFCRLRLWALPEYEISEYCVPLKLVDAHNAAVLASEHRRRRKNLWQKWRREEQRRGTGSAPAKRAREEYESYMAEHELRRGPDPDDEIPTMRLLAPADQTVFRHARRKNVTDAIPKRERRT